MASRHLEAQSAVMPPRDDDQDQPGMQKAIALSLHTRYNSEATPMTDKETEEPNPPLQTCENRVNIDDRINDITMKAAIELPIVHDSWGDTLIYIDAPQRQPEQDEHDYERYIKRYETPILMKKDTLTKYSPGLAKLFGPTQQYRVLRRRKLANKLPSHVKYVIDLTPPSEGEDAVFLTTELCCSEGVRLWYQSGQIWNVSKNLVKGQEEYSSVPLKTTSKSLTGWRQSDVLNMTPAGSEGTGSKANPSTLMPLEYSPVRHRSAIERVLSALQGTDPLLDSATKVWTTFAVAKNFDITHSPLEDYIIRWLRAYPNSYFLEVLPEVSHQIADGLQNYDLARDSFAILVGEEALDSLRHLREPRLHKRTTFGRKKEELPEHIHTRVEYASKSFLERINKDFAYMVDSSMRWIDELPEVHRLSACTQPELHDIVYRLRNLLKDYVRGAIYKVICADYNFVPGPDLHHEGGEDLLPRLDRAAVWANMPLDERILSRTCWEALRSTTTLQAASNLDNWRSWNLKGERERGDLDPLSPTEKRELARGTYREVKSSELRALIRKGQTHLDQTCTELDIDSLSTRLHALPDRTIIGVKDRKQLRELLANPSQDQEIYTAQRESKIKPLPKLSFALPDRTLNGAQSITTNSEASFSTPAQPIDIPKPLKRTQDFHDALSLPDHKQAEIVRTKWPFGAARDDPAAQVLKNVDGLHVSPLSSDRRPAVDNAMEDSVDQGRESEEISAGIDPWRGYSDHLSSASKSLRPLAPKTQLIQATSVPKHRAAPAEYSMWSDASDSDEDQRFQQPLEHSRPNGTYFTTKFFRLEQFFDQAHTWINTFASYQLRSSDHGSLKEPLDLGIVNTLVCLQDSEWKYLPLWAGGNDDGSMGVYNDDLPTAEHGFTTAGPEVHDGSTPANSVKAPSEFELVSAGDSASTFNTSTATNRGFSDAIRRGHVHAADSMDDSMSDSFTMVTPSVDSDDEETFARKQIEAQERIEEAEETAANEAHWIAKGKGKMVKEDESYADFFSGEEEGDGNDTDRAEVDDEDDEDNEDEEDMVMV